MLKVDAIKETKRKKKAYSLLDLEKIRIGCRSNRERAIVEFLASTWCRVTEACEVKISDIQDGKVTVHGKGDKYRECYLNARAQLALEMYLNERKDDNPYLFCKSTMKWAEWTRKKITNEDALHWYANPEYVDDVEPIDKSSIEHIVRNIGKRVGVDKVHPHRFRRTGATMALRAGMPLTTVSKLLGHESIETTQIYLDVSDEELEAAHRKYVV
jgi:site-specific recombinase XerD